MTDQPEAGSKTATNTFWDSVRQCIGLLFGDHASGPKAQPISQAIPQTVDAWSVLESAQE